MHDLWNWLKTDAGAGWIFGLISTGVLLVTWLRRFQTKRVIIEEIAKRRPVSVSTHVRERIDVRFDNKKIERLSQLDLLLRNFHDHTVTDIAFTLKPPNGTKILEAVAAADPVGIDVSKTINDDGEARIEVNYLKTARLHEDAIYVALLCDGPLEGFQCLGGGENWSLKFKNSDRSRPKEIALIVTLAAVLIWIFVYLTWLEPLWRAQMGLDPRPKGSWKSLVLQLPVAIPVFAVFLIQTSVLWSRMLRPQRLMRKLQRKIWSDD